MSVHKLLLALCLSIPLAAQEKPAQAGAEVRAAKVSVKDAEVLFLRAFYLEKGERRFDEAVALYREFLDAAPDHRYAKRAARNAVGLLNRTGKVEAAKELREARAKLIERVPVKDRKAAKEEAAKKAAKAKESAPAKDAEKTDAAEAEPTQRPRGRAAGADAAGRAAQRAERLAQLEDRLAKAKESKDDDQVQRLTRQIERLKAAPAGGARNRGQGRARGGIGRLPPLGEMSEEQLATFKEQMGPLVERQVERLRESGDTARADKLEESAKKVRSLIDEGKLDEAEKLRRELMRGRRRGGD